VRSPLSSSFWTRRFPWAALLVLSLAFPFQPARRPGGVVRRGGPFVPGAAAPGGRGCRSALDRRETLTGKRWSTLAWAASCCCLRPGARHGGPRVAVVPVLGVPWPTTWASSIRP